MAGHAYRDRPLDGRELERLRLALSSFRDGSGQNVLRTGESMPGFRDYERSLAAVLGGRTPENKGVFDVVVPVEGAKPFGISCKMTAFPAAKHECSFMELSNSAAKFRNHLLGLQINWISEPMLAGPALVDLVAGWHTALGDTVDIPSSRYAVLAHDRPWVRFQLLCFPLDLKVANPKGDIEWLAEGNALNGYVLDGARRHRLWQLYPNSGGQLKYFPLLRWATWVSDVFTLERAPLVSPLEKPAKYFPALWPT